MEEKLFEVHGSHGSRNYATDTHKKFLHKAIRVAHHNVAILNNTASSVEPTGRTGWSNTARTEYPLQPDSQLHC